jgi:hypothetical protein
MKQEPAHQDVSRIETAQRVFLEAGNLHTPLTWKVYGDPYEIITSRPQLYSYTAIQLYSYTAIQL